MGKLRVLVVDDAVVVRRMVSEVLATDPEIEVVGTAANGKIALSKITQVNPDIITMDVEMPEMDGLEALKRLRETHPRLPVIMFSTLTERGGTATLDALALGANDYVTKPANVGSVGAAMQRIRDELIPKIKVFCQRTASPEAPRRAAPSSWDVKQVPAAAIRAPFAVPRQIEIVAIGVSTGGPNALAKLIPSLPEGFPVPVVIVQHMPPVFTRLLSERLDSNSNIRVREGTMGSRIQPGVAWIAPGDYHMVIQRDTASSMLRLHQGPPENSCRPAVDVLFRSVAQAYGAGTLGVILTGMGQDGLRGCEAIVEAGGQVIVQDEASSVIWGMPGFVARAGLADRVLPLADISDEIVRRSMVGRSRRSFLKTPAQA